MVGCIAAVIKGAVAHILHRPYPRSLELYIIYPPGAVRKRHPEAVESAFRTGF